MDPRVARNKTKETKPLIILKSLVRSVTMMRVARLNLRTAQQLLTDKRDHSHVCVCETNRNYICSSKPTKL